LEGVAVTHGMLVKQCIALKVIYELDSRDVVFTALDFRQRSGMVLGLFLTVFSGMQLVNMACHISEYIPQWLQTVKRFKSMLASVLKLITSSYHGSR
jgi:hypothetical protein